MAFKPIESAHARWRTVSAPHLIALVRVSTKFESGTRIERSDNRAARPDEPAV
jgi:hypothetical protein